MIRTASAQCQAWMAEGLRAIRMGVNVSGHQIRQPSFVAKVSKALQGYLFSKPVCPGLHSELVR